MFCLSQTTGYAILALACVRGPQGQPALVRDISEMTGISKPYLAKIMHALAAKGLVETKRGYKGGVLLTRRPEDICLMEVAEAVEGTQWLQRCILGHTGCTEERGCPLHAFWSPMKDQVRNRLRAMTLAQVAEFESAHTLRCLPRHQQMALESSE